MTFISFSLKIVVGITNLSSVGVVVVAQLVELSLLIPEARSSKPVFLRNIEKTKRKKNRPGMAHF